MVGVKKNGVKITPFGLVDFAGGFLFLSDYLFLFCRGGGGEGGAVDVANVDNLAQLRREK